MVGFAKLHEHSLIFDISKQCAFGMAAKQCFQVVRSKKRYGFANSLIKTEKFRKTERVVIRKVKNFQSGFGIGCKPSKKSV